MVLSYARDTYMAMVMLGAQYSVVYIEQIAFICWKEQLSLVWNWDLFSSS